MSKLSIIIALVGVSFVAQASTKTFVNDKGCVVEVEKRLNGLTFYITDAEKNTANVGLLSSMDNGNITAFCPNVEVSTAGNIVTLSCDKHEESGAVTTRGEATLDFNNGLSSVAVKGEYKGFFGWKTDTDIRCDDLQPQK